MAAGVSVAVALGAAVVGPIITVRMTDKQLRASREIAQRQINASIVSTSRQNWINALREAIADLLATGGRLQHIIYHQGPVLTEADIERVSLQRSRIALLINPLEEDHKGLVILADELLSVIQASQDPAALRRASELAFKITAQGQAILKREWERVKQGEPTI